MTKFFAVKSKSHLTSGLKWFLLAVLSFALSNSGMAQGWELSFGGVKEDQGQSVIQTIDGGYVIAGYSESFGSDNDLDVFVVRTDVDGTELWMKVYDEGVMEHAYAIIQTEDKGFLIVGDINMPGEDFDIYLLKISPRGKFVWSRTYGSPDAFDQGLDIAKANDGGYVIVGKTQDTASGEDDVIVVKVDDEGNEIWSKTYGGDLDEKGNAIINYANGYAFVGNASNPQGSNTDIVLSHITTNGAEVWSTTISTDQAEEGNDLVETNDGNLVIVGYQGFNNDLLIAKYNESGDTIWTSKFDLFGAGDQGNAIIELTNGDLVLTGQTEVTSSNVDILIAKVNSQGEDLWFTHIGDDIKADFGQDISNTMDGGYVVAGYNSLLLNFFNDLTLIKTDVAGNVLSNFIEGQVFYDTEPDCPGTTQPDFNDISLEGWLVKVKGENNTYFGTTDENGFYSVLVDTGSYNVSVLPSNAYWEPCSSVSDGYELSIEEFYETDTLHFPILPIIDCPYLEVDMSAEFQFYTDCNQAVYNVKYGNKGTIGAEDAYIEVNLDYELTYDSASIDPDQIIGNTLRFDLGDIASLDKGEFFIYTTVSCDVELFQASAATAHIYPDTLCLMGGPDWDGSSITVTGICEADSVRFDILNIGDPVMDTLQYIVVEDQVMFLQGSFSTNMLTRRLPANGSTYRMIVEQSEGHPGMNFPTVAVEGCVTNENDDYSTGFVTQFPENDQDAFISIDVQEIQDIVGSAPVEMRGYPKGYNDNLIAANTDINYLISFRNVGTDTIQRVVIRDTLSDKLDLERLVPGASSHPYDYEVYDNGILKITLSDIQLLPGSSAEEAFTHGFVKFRIAQKPDNPVGTIINNSAAIFLDYDAPVQTNVVSHEVGWLEIEELIEDVIIITSDEDEYVPGLEIKIYPNPFVEGTTFELIGKTYKTVDITIFDLNGRLIKRDRFRGNQFHFYRNLLPQGIFVYKLESEGQLLDTGKIMVR